MAIAAIGTQRQPGEAGALATLVRGDSCAGHPVLARLAEPLVAGRDLADAVHALCAVHGRAPDLFESAALRPIPGDDARWVGEAITAFGVERAYLAQLTAAVGPLPSTPGQAESDAAFAALRHAFDMLGRSDRTGCAIGAALALMIDWRAFRTVLDSAAGRSGVSPPPLGLPAMATVAAVAATAGDTPSVARALAFGAQQAFAQHRGLCDLIEARAAARTLL